MQYAARNLIRNRTLAADSDVLPFSNGKAFTVRNTSPAATVAIGAVLSVGALLGSTAIVVLAHPGSTARIVIVGVAFVIAIVGGVMMLKDLTP